MTGAILHSSHFGVDAVVVVAHVERRRFGPEAPAAQRVEWGGDE
jgi:hypothetical protein